jgi:hypothetical protein
MTDIPHPDQAEPSLIESIHAHKVSLLPLRNDQGSYDRHTPPDLSTSAQIGDYIQSRTAAWTQHIERKRQQGQGWTMPKVPKLPGGPKDGRKAARKPKRR